MKTGQLETVRAAAPTVETRAVPSVWRPALTIAALSALALILVYAGTYWSMVSIWWRSDTFAHGFFILPISLYLVWTEKEELRELKPMPDWKGIVAVAALGFGWLLARLANVLVVEQYLAVASLIAVLYTVLGPTVSRRIAFPLGFLLFAVPIGEALIPTLIDHTTAFVVWALQLAGIPVLRNGNVLTLPNGVWSVVEACSGLRYLIACITIGLPFAYLMYSSWKRRAAFVALSVVVPIVANWVRAFMIIWLGYVSDMRLAKGVDHLIYGWVLYAVIMFLLLWVGSLFRDDMSSRESQGSVPSASVWPRESNDLGRHRRCGLRAPLSDLGGPRAEGGGRSQPVVGRSRASGSVCRLRCRRWRRRAGVGTRVRGSGLDSDAHLPSCRGAGRPTTRALSTSATGRGAGELGET